MSGSNQSPVTTGTITTSVSVQEARAMQTIRMNALYELERTRVCLRRLTLAFNLFFWICGPAMVGLTVWCHLLLSDLHPIIPSYFVNPAYILSVAGGAAILTGIVGCVGGVGQNKRLLIVYSSLVLVICALEISATVYTFTQYDKVSDTLRANLDHAIESYTQDEDYRKAMDKIQQKFTCCGIESSSDWFSLSSLTGPIPPLSIIQQIPSSCCPSSLTDQAQCSMESSTLFEKGCFPELKDWTRWVLLVLGWSSFALACTQMLGIAVACCLIKAVGFVAIYAQG